MHFKYLPQCRSKLILQISNAPKIWTFNIFSNVLHMASNGYGCSDQTAQSGAHDGMADRQLLFAAHNATTNSEGREDVCMEFSFEHIPSLLHILKIVESSNSNLSKCAGFTLQS